MMPEAWIMAFNAPVVCLLPGSTCTSDPPSRQETRKRFPSISTASSISGPASTLVNVASTSEGELLVTTLLWA